MFAHKFVVELFHDAANHELEGVVDKEYLFFMEFLFAVSQDHFLPIFDSSVAS